MKTGNPSRVVAAFATGLLVALTALADSATQTPGERPKAWAQPVSVEGVPNLHKVSGRLFRSAQPSAAGMANLKGLGIKTVVNLRAFHSDTDEIGTTGLGYERLYLKTWHPEKEDVVRFLKIVADPQKTPVLVHCQHGADRTGTLCAVYRMAVQGWPKAEALREMTAGGFGFHGVWQNLLSFIDGLDWAAIRKEAGIGNKP